MADTMRLGVIPIRAGSGEATIAPLTTGTPVTIVANPLSPAFPGLVLGTLASLSRITAGSLTLGNAASGPVTIVDPLKMFAATNINLASASDIIFNPGWIVNAHDDGKLA